jgi:hypothetical protein
MIERIGRMLNAIGDGDESLKEYHKTRGRE